MGGPCLFHPLFPQRAIFSADTLTALHSAVLSVDMTANFRNAVALLRHLRRIQRLVLADVSGRGMIIGIAREER